MNHKINVVFQKHNLDYNTWLPAFLFNRKKQRPAYTVVAASVLLIIYSIRHSMYGSQPDPETGEIIQGWIRILN